MSEICERLEAVRARIRAAESRFGRPEGSVQLLAVSKTKPDEAIRAAHACGQRAFGENYAQELADKAQRLADLDLEWHYIGPLQSNKTRLVAEHAHWMHSIDREKIARRLAAQRPAGMSPLQVCLQVNVSAEPQKAGVLPEALPALAEAVAGIDGLVLRGLMTIPARSEDFDRQRAAFARLRHCLEDLQTRGFTGLDTLSMGMTGDLEAAIAEGATLVRVGTAIFGPREAPRP
ncbi:MAG: YggS family pyridoxal phosphate-dependent enzyme [Gammaproteobacteria bacterium]|nr:MAG: YggS family pyridoxal phosphate-dependent enzyme [Gammaproteobacteria bacterium]